MSKITDKKILKSIKSLKIDKTLEQYYTQMVKICVEKNIKAIDIVLTKDIYPILSFKYGKSPNAIKTELIRTINRQWKNGGLDVFCSKLSYDRKPTVKKLLILALEYINA